MRISLRIMLSNSCSWSAMLLVTASSSQLAAQITSDTFSLDPRVLGEEHLAQLTGDYGDCAALELSGDQRADAIFLVGDQPVFSYGPGLFHAFSSLPQNANEIAVWNKTQIPQEDRLLTVSTRGLEACQLDSSQTNFDFELLAQGAWVSASLLRTADLNGDGIEDIFARSSDPSVVIGLGDPFGSQQSLFWNIGAPVVDIAAIEWDGSAGSELAVLSATALKVCELNGDTLINLPVGTVSDSIAVLSSNGAGTDRLVRLNGPNSGDQMLTVYGPYGGIDSLNIGNLGAYVMTSADFDSDGHSDLAIAQSSTGQPLLLRNLGGSSSSQTFELSSGNYTFLGTPQANPSTEAVPAAADLDNDGDQDLLLPNQNGSRLDFFRNHTIDHLPGTVAIVEGALAYDYPSQTGSLAILLELPSQLPPNANAVEVTVWYQPESTGSAQALASEYQLHAGLNNMGVVIDINGPLGPDPDQSSIHNIELRLTHYDSTTQTVLSAWPSEVWSIGHDTPLKDLAERHGIDNPEIVYFGDANGGQVGVGIGGTPIGCVPCIPDEEVPHRPNNP